MRKLIILSFFLFSWHALFSQEFTLKNCWEMARENYPLIKGIETLSRNTELNIRNINSQWLPQMTVSGQASWQSDVPHVDVGSGMPGFSIPQAPKDQYKVSLDVSQTIYDAGKTKALEDLKQASGLLEEQNIEIELYEIKRHVTDLYFNILMLAHQEMQVKQKLETLKAKKNEMSSLYDNGMIQNSALKNLSAESLLVQQELIGIQSGIKVLLDNLSTYIGRNIISPQKLEVPVVKGLTSPEGRPEYRLFQYQKDRLKRKMILAERNRWPVLAAFGQIGYGNPGYNMLKDEFDAFYMVGLKLKWTPWDWKETHREKLVIENQVHLINYREEAFSVNQKRAVRQIDGEIDRFFKVMEYDEQIVNMREEVVARSEARLKNGTITSSDYLQDLDAAVNAKINRDIHMLNYLKSMAFKYITTGKTQIQ